MKAIVTFASLLIANITAAQYLKLDSLKKELANARQDSSKVKLVHAMA